MWTWYFIINIDNVITYVATDIVKNIKNNIIEHFDEYVFRFVNVSFLSNQFLQYSSNNEKIEFRRITKEIKTKILAKEPIELIQFMPGDFLQHLRFLMPQRPLQNDNWRYDIKCSPLDYLPSMLYMLSFLESREETIPYHVVPEKSSLIPGYIMLDTKTILSLFGGTGTALGPTTRYNSNGRAGARGLYSFSGTIWGTIFKTNKKVFKRNQGWKFAFLIQTDGIGCSILFKKPFAQQGNEEMKEFYIQDAEIDQVQGKTIVAIDPGKSDLLYCISKNPPQVEKYWMINVVISMMIPFLKTKMNKTKLEQKSLSSFDTHRINEDLKLK
jgi:hypothetical protein